jgi:hypothetical protein
MSALLVPDVKEKIEDAFKHYPEVKAQAIRDCSGWESIA